jgi:hypothetical protein
MDQMSIIATYENADTLVAVTTWARVPSVAASCLLSRCRKRVCIPSSPSIPAPGLAWRPVARHGPG